MEQAGLSKILPHEDSKLRMDAPRELAESIMLKFKGYMDGLESEAGKVEVELAPVHRTFTQTALYPLLLRTPFIYRMCIKLPGYTNGYEVVNRVLSDLREGPNIYFQIVNATLLHTDVAKAHRNRIDILVQYLGDFIVQTKAAG